MRLSTRVRYGVRALLDVALNGEQGAVSLRDIAERQEISLLYLQQLIKPLIAGGLVTSARGPRGGLSLSRPPAEISLGDIFQVLEGPFSPVDCTVNPNGCARHTECATRETWTEIKTAVDTVLASTTLQHLMERQRDKVDLGVLGQG
jgi:Rrf2 family protein